MPLGDAVAFELIPEVVDHHRVGQRSGMGRFDSALLHPLLDDVDGGAQHGVVERDPDGSQAASNRSSMNG